MKKILVITFQKKIKGKEHYGELETSFMGLLPLAKTCFDSGYTDLRVECREIPEPDEENQCQEIEL